MPKAKITKLCAILAATLAFAGVSNAQPVLGDMINRAKAMKQRPSQGGAQSGAAMVEDGAQNLALWSISGINNTLYAEIWQGDSIHRLLLKAGAKLPSGWQVVSADKRSVTLKLGEEVRRLYPTAPGSTGWEFSQTPRVAVSNVPTPAGANMAPARIAASNLPPMSPINSGSGRSMSSPPATSADTFSGTSSDASSSGGVGQTPR